MERGLRVVTSNRVGGVNGKGGGVMGRRFKFAIERLFERPKFRPGPRYTTQFSKTLWITLLS